MLLHWIVKTTRGPHAYRVVVVGIQALRDSNGMLMGIDVDGNGESQQQVRNLEAR